MEHDLRDPLVHYRAPIPPPRDVPIVATEHHCAGDCAHLREAWRRGVEFGQRAERERADRELIGLSLLVPMLAAVAVGLATVVAWMRWGGDEEATG